MTLRRVLLTNTGIALFPTLLSLSLGSSPRQVWRTFLSSLVYSHVIGGLAHLILNWTWPRCARLRLPWNWALQLAILFAVAIVGTLIACIVLLLVGFTPAGRFWSVYWVDLRFAALITFVAGIVISIYESMRVKLEETTLELRTKELERERALKLATEARLSSLESRLHPHFLFNTLNSISSLIQDDPARAERLVERMAALLRFSLDSKQNGLVPLEHELKVVTDYLEIEKARFGDRLRFEIAVPEQLGQVRVPPLSLQTLVENSVKYVVAPSRSGGEIRVSGECTGTLLQLTVADSGPGFDLDQALPGHGIDNLRSRLSTLFGNRASLRRENPLQGSAVSLNIPQNGERYEGLPRR
jgi:two-component system, LytTR family, sensor histidine kinase AlgZ